jgi:hypothetical protein
MAEDSRPWSGTVTGDAGPYPDDDWTDWWEAMSVADNTVECVLRDRLNELAVTGVATPVSVATGQAIVDGTYYENTSVVTVAIPTPAVATRVDLIVLDKDWVAQTVRIARVAGVEGAGAPAVTQVDGTTWEIALAEVSIDIGGSIVVTDVREFINLPIAVGFDDTDGDPENLADAAADGTSEFAARLDHVHPARADRIVFDERGADPALIANAGQVYTKDDGAGHTELYYQDEAGNVEKLNAQGLVLIQEQVVSGGAVPDLTFTIPAGYGDLLVIGNILPATDATDPYMQINGDTGVNYAWSVEATTAVEAQVQIWGNHATITNTVGGMFKMWIPYYLDTVFKKFATWEIVGMSGGNIHRGSGGMRWDSLNAITSLKFYMSVGNLQNGTRIAIYGTPT